MQGHPWFSDMHVQNNISQFNLIEGFIFDDNF